MFEESLKTAAQLSYEQEQAIISRMRALHAGGTKQEIIDQLVTSARSTNDPVATLDYYIKAAQEIDKAAAMTLRKQLEMKQLSEAVNQRYVPNRAERRRRGIKGNVGRKK